MLLDVTNGWWCVPGGCSVVAHGDRKKSVCAIYVHIYIHFFARNRQVPLYVVCVRCMHAVGE